MGDASACAHGAGGMGFRLLCGGGMSLTFRSAIRVVSLLSAVQKEGSWLSADFFQSRSKEVGVVALDEELMDRIGDSEGHCLRGDREDRYAAEPAFKAIGADTVPDLGCKASPKGGKGILISSRRLLGRETEGSVQRNKKSWGRSRIKTDHLLPQAETPFWAAFIFRKVLKTLDPLSPKLLWSGRGKPESRSWCSRSGRTKAKR